MAVVTEERQSNFAAAKSAFEAAEAEKGRIDRAHAEAMATLRNLQEQREALTEHKQRLAQERFTTGKDNGYADVVTAIEKLDKQIAEAVDHERAAVQAHMDVSAHHERVFKEFQQARHQHQAAPFNQLCAEILAHGYEINRLWAQALGQARSMELSGNGAPMRTIGTIRTAFLHPQGDGALDLRLPDITTANAHGVEI